VIDEVKDEGKGKGREICIAPRRKKLNSETLRHGLYSFYTANAPCLPLPRKRSPDGATTSNARGSPIASALHILTDFHKNIVQHSSQY